MKKRKVTISVTLSYELIEWIEKKIEDLTFSSRSHAIEKALTELKKKMEEGGN